MFAGPVCLCWVYQPGLCGGEEMLDISENLACSGLLTIFPIWGCSSFQKSWWELMVCPESRIWNRPKLCEEQLSFSSSWASGRLQPVLPMTPRPWPLAMPRPSPCRMLLLTADLQGRGCCRQGEQDGVPCQVGRVSAAQEGQECPLHQPRQAELSLLMVVVASARRGGCHQIPECPHLWEFPCIPEGGLVTLHRLTAGVGAGWYPASGHCHPQGHLFHHESFGSTEGLFYTRAAQRS